MIALPSTKPPMNEEEIFQAATGLSPPERSSYLARVCTNQTTLRVRVERLLASHDDALFMIRAADRPPKERQGMAAEECGEWIGSYKLLQKVGEGGCGVVYMAQQEQPVRRTVAVKVIKLGMDTRSVIARFEQERQALALMDHANIARVFDAGATPQGRPFFVMELVRGVRITEFCEENGLGIEERLQLFIAVCQAIQHAHQKGVIHRDIKPTNILVTLHDGVPVPKVIDFGIAKATSGQSLTDKTLFTAFEQFVGTPAYMSPEQAEMSGLDVDTRSDIYSLGILLYELLTGQTPFDGEELMASGIDAMRKTIREKDPERPSTRLSRISAAGERTKRVNGRVAATRPAWPIDVDLDWIVMKCLEKDRTRRYETVNGLAADLRRHLNNETVVARPPTPLYRFQRTFRRNKVVLTAGALVALALLLGTAVSTYLAIRATRAERAQGHLLGQTERARLGESDQRRQAENAERALRQQLYASDMIVTAHALENGDFGFARRLLARQRPERGDEDLRGFEWRYLWGQSRGEQEKVLIGHSDRVLCLAYSPDGTMLASGSSDHTVKIWNVRTGAAIITCEGHKREVLSLAFSPDGRFMASGEDGFVHLRDVSDWRIVLTFTNRYAHVAFSGPFLAIATGGDLYGDGEGTVQLWDYVTGVEATAWRDSGTRVAFSPNGKTLATANAGGVVKLRDRTTGLVTGTFPAREVRALVFSPDSRWLAWNSGWQGELWAWDLKEQTPHLLGIEIKNNALSLSFSRDSQTLAAAGQSHALTLWDIFRKERRQLRGQGSQVLAVACSPDDGSLASAGQDGKILFWNSAAGRSATAITNLVIDQWHSVGHPVISSDGRTLVGPLRTEEMRIWDIETGRIEASLLTTNLPVSFSPDNRTLLLRSAGFNSLETWNIAAGRTEPAVNLGPPLGDYYADAFSPDGKMIATAHRTEISLRNAGTGERLFPLEHSELSRSVVFSADSELLAAGGFSRSARIWDLRTHQLIATVDGFQDTVSAVAFSPDRTLFAAGSFAGMIKVSELRAGGGTSVLAEYQAAVKQLAFSVDGKTLASTADDCAVHLWNMGTFREVTRFQTEVSCSYLAFSADGQTLAAADLNGKLYLWRAPLLAQIESAQEAPVLGVKERKR